MKRTGGALVLGAGLLLARTASACPFCNVGSRETWGFILLVVGAFVVGAASVLVWSVRSGQWQDPDAVAQRVLELDRTTDVRR